MEKKGRSKIFDKGKKQVNIDAMLYKQIEKESVKTGLYPSQVINNIIRNHFSKEENKSFL